MADTKIVGGRGLIPSPSPSPSPTPPFDLETFTLYVRPDGSNADGDGSRDKPYRTLQHAVRQVPSIPAPGATIVFDITGITETLPSDYQFPVIQTSTAGGFTAGSSPYPFYVYQSGVTIRALPQLTSLLSPADATITAADTATVSSDPVSNLVTLNIAGSRVNWGSNALKGKQLIRTVKSPTSNQATCVIYGSDASNLYLCNDAGSLNGGNGPLALAADEVLQIVEPSATLIGSPPTGGSHGISCWGFNAVVFQGIHFAAPPGLYALQFGNADIPAIELCVIDGLLSINTPNGLEFFGTTLTTAYDLEPVPGLLARSLFMNFGLPESYFYVAAFLQTFNDVVFDDTCPTLTSGFFFAPLGSNWGFENVLFQGSQGDAIHADYGRWNLTNVLINNSQGNALTVDTGPVAVSLTNVGGTGNTGFGLVVDDGAQVRVTDTATNVGGVMKVGGLPGRSWADFYGSTPFGNQYDLVTPFVLNVASSLSMPQGNDSAGACTGSRVFQK